MEDLKKSDIVAEAFEKTREIRESSQNKVKRLIEHSAAAISITVVLLTVILYAFNKGYYRVYNIPIEIIPLDLKSYLPLAVQLCGVMIYVLYYIIALLKEKLISQKHGRLIRMLYGWIILSYIFTHNNLQNAIGNVAYLVLPALIPAIIEIIIYLINRPRKDKVVDKTVHRIILEDSTRDILLYELFVKYGLFVPVLAVLIASPLGKIKATANLSYQTCVIDEELYAVIVDLDDMVLVENAEEEGNVLSIKTTSYRYIPKENLVLTYQEYEDVDIIQEQT